jgi:hypothetical protein
LEHVFAETNWLVGCLAPAHHKLNAALELLEKAGNGQVVIHIPTICVAECQRPLREKFQVKLEADRVRKFLLWAKSNGTIGPEQEETVRRTLSQMEGLVRRDLDRLTDSLKELCVETGIDVFHIEEEMWLRNTALSHSGLQLQPFDQAILASILVRPSSFKNRVSIVSHSARRIPIFNRGTGLGNRKKRWLSYTTRLRFGCSEIF